MDISIDGAPVFCHAGGVEPDRSRPAVVLLHGAGMDHSVWRFQTRTLAHAGYSVLAPDLPGHGRSSGEPLTSIEEMAGWVVRLLDASGVERACAVGHSMGSLVAIELGASHPDRVERLVLMATASEMRVHPELMAAAERGDRVAVDLMVGWMHTGHGRFGAHPQPGSWFPEMSARLLERHLERALAVDLAACAAYPAGRRAKTVACPTLVMIGGRDRMTPPTEGRAVAEAIRGSTTETLGDSGHMLVVDDPGRVRQILTGFIASGCP